MTMKGLRFDVSPDPTAVVSVCGKGIGVPNESDEYTITSPAGA
jgi:hypothetical protein